MPWDILLTTQKALVSQVHEMVIVSCLHVVLRRFSYGRYNSLANTRLVSSACASEITCGTYLNKVITAKLMSAMSIHYGRDHYEVPQSKTVPQTRVSDM